MNDDNGSVSRVLLKPIPDRIKEAREARGYTIESFSVAIERTKQAVAQYETGQSTPSGEVMAKIIALTHQPPSFFTNSPIRSGRSRTVFWRGLKRMNLSDRKRIRRRLQWTADITNFVDDFVALPNVNIPSLDFDPESATDLDIEAAAELLREKWGIGNGPIGDLAGILERNGVIIVRESVACADMDAVSCWISGRPFILLSQEIGSGARDTFNLCHELGHILLHSLAEVSDDNLKKIEKQANAFASAFLMPRSTFSRELLGTSIEYFKSMKMRWGVSIAAMAYRCKSLGIINENQLGYINKQMNIMNIRKIEPHDFDLPVSEPHVLRESIKMIVEHNVCTRHEIESKICLNLRDIEQLSGLEFGYLDRKVHALQFRKNSIS